MLKLTCITFAGLLIIANFWMLEENGVDMNFDFKKDGLCEVRTAASRGSPPGGSRCGSHARALTPAGDPRSSSRT